MALFHIILVAFIQGVTEFLPISSSGHLVLVPHITGYDDQGLMIDVAVHLGTLFAVILYFREDAIQALRGLADLVGRKETPAARLAFLLIIATIPAVLLGLIFSIFGISDLLRNIAVIGWSTLIFGLILWWFDQKSEQSKKANEWRQRDAWIMGLWQAAALIPGTSRSGACITGARMLGYERKDGTKIAMLMSIPTIIASSVLTGGKLIASGEWTLAADAALAMLLAFGTALLALKLMMKLLESISFTPYVLYRIVLGVGLLIWAYGW